MVRPRGGERIIHRRAGDLLWAGGDFPGALREYGRASSLSAGLLARDPASAERGYLQLGHRAAAQAVLTRSIAIYAEMAGAGTVSIDQRSEHGVALRRAGDADLEADKRALARAHYEAAARLLEADPRDLEYEGELALVYMGSTCDSVRSCAAVPAAPSRSLPATGSRRAAIPGAARRHGVSAQGASRPGALPLLTPCSAAPPVGRRLAERRRLSATGPSPVVPART